MNRLSGLSYGGRSMAHYNTYDQWKHRVDAFIIAKIGVDSECLPDYNYQAAFVAGKAASVTANAAIAAARKF